jgi:hypothetical protein
MSFALAPADETFLRDAPQRYEFRMQLPVPADTVWAEGLAGDRPLSWVRGLTVRWTSPAPRGVGTTRVAHAAFGAVRLQERYFVWDEGRRTALR